MLTFCFNAVDGLMTETETLTSGMVGKIVKLEFSSDWDNLQKTAVFVAGPTTKDVLNVTDEAVIPHEVLQNYGDRLYVGIYGVAGDGTVTPTIYARGPRISRGADPSGDESAEASPPVWAQLQAQIDDLKNGGTGGGSGSDSTQNANAEVGYKWAARGCMREQVRPFQGWAHNVRFDPDLGKAVGLIISGTKSHSMNEPPWYRVTIDPATGYMSEYEEITLNEPEDVAKTDCGYIGSFVIKPDGTYWMCDYYKRIWTSVDKGYTWDYVTSITLGRDTTNNDFLFGAIRLSNGYMVAGNGGNPAAESYYSTDDGVTWNVVTMDRSGLGQQTYPEGYYTPFEPCFIEVGEGKVVQYARASMNAFNTYDEGTYSAQEAAVYSISEDYGMTWTPWAWSTAITDMTANNGRAVVIGEKIHMVYGSRYGAEDNDFHLRYATTTLTDILNDTWETPVVIDVGHWNTATAANSHDCGYPSLFADANNNLFAVYYDGDGTGSEYGANWRLCVGTPGAAQIAPVTSGGSGSMVTGYTQAAVDGLLKAQKTDHMAQIAELYRLIGQLPPDSGENDGSAYITDGLVDFWEPQIAEKWDTSGSYPILNGSAVGLDAVPRTRVGTIGSSITIDETTGLMTGGFGVWDAFAELCTDEFTWDLVFYTTDNSDGPMKLASTQNTQDTTNHASIAQATSKWDSQGVNLSNTWVFGTEYPLTNKISHIVITGKNGALHFWMNGAKITEWIDENIVVPLSGYIGAAGFKSQVADVRLYSKALSDEEINNNYLFEKSRWTLGAVS